MNGVSKLETPCETSFSTNMFSPQVGDARGSGDQLLSPSLGTVTASGPCTCVCLHAEDLERAFGRPGLEAFLHGLVLRRVVRDDTAIGDSLVVFRSRSRVVFSIFTWSRFR